VKCIKVEGNRITTVGLTIERNWKEWMRQGEENNGMKEDEGWRFEISYSLNFNVFLHELKV
jgi:hypothetical protein